MNIAFDIRMHQGEKVELFDRPASAIQDSSCFA